MTCETQAVKNTLCTCLYHLNCFDVQKSIQHFSLTKKTLRDGWFETKKNRFHIIKVLISSVEGDSVHLHKFCGEPQIHFWINMSTQLQNLSAVTGCTLLRYNLQRLLLVDKSSRQLQTVWEIEFSEKFCIVLVRFRQNLPKETISRMEIFLQTFSVDHVN